MSKDSFRGRPAAENDSRLSFRRSQSSDHDEMNYELWSEVCKWVRMSFEYSCDKCPGLKLSSKGQRNKHNSLHKRGFLDPGGDIGVAKKISAGNKVGVIQW